MFLSWRKIFPLALPLKELKEWTLLLKEVPDDPFELFGILRVLNFPALDVGVSL